MKIWIYVSMEGNVEFKENTTKVTVLLGLWT